MTLVAAPAYATQKILVFGDSLSAAYGLEQKQGWVSLLQIKLKTLNYNASVVNASISGETTSGGANRIKVAIKQHRPDIVLIQLGANDGLRGLSLNEIQHNLNQILAAVKEKKTKIVLIGMKIPPNYGIQYTRQFSATFEQLAKQYHANLVPFLLEGVGGDPDLMQADGLHPKAEAQAKLLENVWSQLQPLLAKPPSN
ncbi:MAG: arylesterase [Methylophilaceae bacterium]